MLLVFPVLFVQAVVQIIIIQASITRARLAPLEHTRVVEQLFNAIVRQYVVDLNNMD